MVNHYLILENIGEGSYAKVKLASRRLLGVEQKYALKIFSKSVLKKKIDFFKCFGGQRLRLLSCSNESLLALHPFEVIAH